MDKINFVSPDPISIINDRVIITMPCFKAIVDCISEQATAINGLIDAVEDLNVRLDGAKESAESGISDAKELAASAKSAVQTLATAIQKLGGLE